MKEIRIATIKAEERATATADAKSLTLWGQPIVYDIPTTIHDPAGDYIEIIKSGALDEADITDVSLFYNHDLNKVPLARTPKTMTLTNSTAGLEMLATLPNTASAIEVYEAVKREVLTGMSFAFTVPEGGDVYDPYTNTRTIYKIAKLYECSIVPYPAYPQTSIEARNERTASINSFREKQKAKILVNQILKVEV